MPYFLDKILQKPPQILVTYLNLMPYSPLAEMYLDTHLFYFRFYMNILAFLHFSLSCFDMAAKMGKKQMVVSCNTFAYSVIYMGAACYDHVSGC